MLVPIPNGFDALTIKVEASCTLEGEQRIELYNYLAGTWDQVDTKTATALDSVVEHTVTQNPNDYIEAGTLKMKALIGWFDPVGGAVPIDPVAKVDEVHWALKQ